MIDLIKYINSKIPQKYWTSIKKYEKLGGMTNLNIKLFTDSGVFVVRICHNGTFGIINRSDETVNSKLVFENGIDKSFLFIDEVSGLKISKFINKGENLTPKTALKSENMDGVVLSLKKLHNSNIQFNNIFDPYEMILKYEYILKNNEGIFFDDYDEVKKIIFSFREKLKSTKFKLVSCHNDTVPENFIIDKENINIIDWEYSGMNDLVWDLAAHSLECNFNDNTERIFLEKYYEAKCSDNILWRIKLYKVLQDFLWSLWSNIKVSYGEDLMEYSLNRYNRAKKIMEQL